VTGSGGSSRALSGKTISSWNASESSEKNGVDSVKTPREIFACRGRASTSRDRALRSTQIAACFAQFSACASAAS